MQYRAEFLGGTVLVEGSPVEVARRVVATLRSVATPCPIAVHELRDHRLVDQLHAEAGAPSRTDVGRRHAHRDFDWREAIGRAGVPW